MLRQDPTAPLFPELLWSRPENRRLAGKLLIIGGNLHGFAAPAEAYKLSVEAGIGTAKVLLPDALKATVGSVLENGEYAPSTPSGSFSKQALAEMLDHAAWADGVLLAGDLGRNSETAVTLEQFLQKTPGIITLTKDSVDYFYTSPKTVLGRPATTIVLSIAQLQKLCLAAKFLSPITFSMDLMKLAASLEALTTEYPCSLVVQHAQHLIVAHGGRSCAAPNTEDEAIWRVRTAARCCVWELQHPSKPFEALATAILPPTDE